MYQGVNGSGKHNNWSIATNDGTNILNVAQLAKNSGSSDIFPVVMAAIVKVRVSSPHSLHHIHTFINIYVCMCMCAGCERQWRPDAHGHRIARKRLQV